MKRLFGGGKKKKLKLDDSDDDAGGNDNHDNSYYYKAPSLKNNDSDMSSHSAAAYDFQRVKTDSFPDIGGANSGIDNSINNRYDNVAIGAGYRYAVTAFNDTINPLLSNEDGMGGGGGTLRSRLRGSGGSKHRSLIPSFVGQQRRRQQHPLDSSEPRRNDNWSPIPEEPKSPTPDDCDDLSERKVSRVVTFASTEEDGCQSISAAFINPPGYSARHGNNDDMIHGSNSSENQKQLTYSKQQHHQLSQPLLILQPDAIYEEQYGDAYIDQLPKYLYPSGYQSMRPRSGPWKLSIFIFCLFLWLSVFIVGHCYDRGKEQFNNGQNNNNYNNRNNNYNNNGDAAEDDAYLEEVDDDAIFMEARWCGSKLLHFMWMISVAITVLAMSYCSIIGYVKVRDVAVANGRSQPAGTFHGGDGGEGNSGWKSDYYSKLDNVSSSTRNGGENKTNNCSNDEQSEGGSNNKEMYSSYQAGGGGRYIPSIYQSDGMPQFLGGHIYRPTQAAITMTNRR